LRVAFGDARYRRIRTCSQAAFRVGFGTRAPAVRLNAGR
jgi:hypothetical protein